MVKVRSYTQYIQDKLSLGKCTVSDRDIGVYHREGQTHPDVSRAYMNLSATVGSLEEERHIYSLLSQAVVQDCDNELKQLVATQLLEEEFSSPTTLSMLYEPERLVDSVKKRGFRDINEYKLFLEARYSQTIFEDSVSLILTATLQTVPDGVTVDQLSSSVIDEYVNCARDLKHHLIWLSPGITPEEKKVLRAQSSRRLKRRRLATDEQYLAAFLETALREDVLISEIKSKYDPSQDYYTGYCASIISQRLNDAMPGIEEQSEEIQSGEVHEHVFGRGSDVDHEASTAEMISAITECLSSLSDKARFLLRVKFIDQLSHADASASMRGAFNDEASLTVDNIPYRIKQLKKELSALLADSGLDDPEHMLDAVLTYLKESNT